MNQLNKIISKEKTMNQLNKIISKLYKISDKAGVRRIKNDLSENYTFRFNENGRFYEIEFIIENEPDSNEVIVLVDDEMISLNNVLKENNIRDVLSSALHDIWTKKNYRTLLAISKFEKLFEINQ